MKANAHGPELDKRPNARRTNELTNWALPLAGGRR
jgi:hypothetical protein